VVQIDICNIVKEYVKKLLAADNEIESSVSGSCGRTKTELKIDVISLMIFGD
jgi:hypothetical protein